MRFTKRQVDQAVNNARNVWFASGQLEKGKRFREGLALGFFSGLVVGALTVFWLTLSKVIQLPA